MASEDNNLAVAALAVALVALLTTVGQLLQQYFGTADGFRRCQISVVGPWAQRTRLKFRWSEFRFETLFTVPHIILQRTTWVSSETPPCPYDDGAWIIGRAEGEKNADKINHLVSGRTEDSPELVTWLLFLRSIQWTHKQMLFKLRGVAEPLSEKNDLKLLLQENRRLTIPVVKFEERSWDFMPPDVVKPYARINLGDLAVLARRLEMQWERFEPSDGILRAQGNGYNLTSVLVRSVGTMVEISEILGSGAQGVHLPWLTPVIPEQVERKTLLIPNAAADKMAFGLCPGVGSDFFNRDFDVGDLANVPSMIRYFTRDERLVAAFVSGKWRQAKWCPGVADLLGFIAPMLYRPELGLMGVPAPDNGLIFHGVTVAGPAFEEFKASLLDLVRQTRPSPSSDVLWVRDQIIKFSGPSFSSDWFHEVDWVAKYWNETATRQVRPPQYDFYDCYRTATAKLKALDQSRSAPRQNSLYKNLVIYHLRHMFYPSSSNNVRRGSPTMRTNNNTQLAFPFSGGGVGSDNNQENSSAWPYPEALSSESDLWAQRMQTYFKRLPDLVDDMILDGLGHDAETLRGAWLLLMLRGMCWHRCHVLISGKTVPIQYCGSQLPVYLG